jgi:siderophore synthetase component
MAPRSTILTVVALGLATGLPAQGTQPSPEVERWIAEIREIQATVGPVQQQALREPAIQQAQQEATRALRAAMVAADPSMSAKLDRMERIVAETRTAREARDEAKVRALTDEALALEPQISGAQERAMALPEIETRLTAFRARLRARMVEIDPATGPLIARMEVLSRQVQAAMRGGG